MPGLTGKRIGRKPGNCAKCGLPIKDPIFCRDGQLDYHMPCMFPNMPTSTETDSGQTDHK